MQATLKLVLENVIEILANITKALDQFSVCLDSIKSIMPSAVVSEEASQLQRDVNVIIKWHSALSIEMNLHFSRLVYRFAIVKQNLSFAFVAALIAQHKSLTDASSWP